MRTYPIVYYPTPILNKRSSVITQITEEWRALVHDMVRTMHENEGIGLAAPQINIPKRLVIVRDAKEDLAFFNAQIVSKSKETDIQEEGSLSLPGIFIPIKRAKSITVKAQLPDGNTIEMKAEGMTARIFQHEIDHLNGFLIINRVSPLARFRLRKELREFKKQNR